MILWMIKLLSSVRRALAGRKYPHQLAGGVALGLLLGVVPHGNLLAIALLIVVLSLKINHAMAGLTAVGATFLAAKLDPYSHRVGEYVLTHPKLSEAVADAWQLPMMPWTDLNNTVVMGSFLIGVGALAPVFALTYPVFKFLEPSESSPDRELDNRASLYELRDTRSATPHQVIVVDEAHRTVPPPRRGATRETLPASRRTPEPVHFEEIEPSEGTEIVEDRVAVETRIDVIRMKDYRATETPETDDSDQQPMDEALNYLLRQLRDSQQRKAA